MFDPSELLLRRHAVNQPPTFTLTRDVPTVPWPSTVSMLTTRVPTGGTPQPNFRKNGNVRETPADNDIEPGIGSGEELGIGTGTELGSGTDELGIDVPLNGAADVGINLDVEVVPSRSRKSNPIPRMNTS
jgi:hypothetical protein